MPGKVNTASNPTLSQAAQAAANAALSPVFDQSRSLTASTSSSSVNSAPSKPPLLSPNKPTMNGGIPTVQKKPVGIPGIPSLGNASMGSLNKLSSTTVIPNPLNLPKKPITSSQSLPVPSTQPSPVPPSTTNRVPPPTLPRPDNLAGNALPGGLPPGTIVINGQITKANAQNQAFLSPQPVPPSPREKPKQATLEESQHAMRQNSIMHGPPQPPNTSASSLPLHYLSTPTSPQSSGHQQPYSYSSGQASPSIPDSRQEKEQKESAKKAEEKEKKEDATKESGGGLRGLMSKMSNAMGSKRTPNFVSYFKVKMLMIKQTRRTRAGWKSAILLNSSMKYMLALKKRRALSLACHNNGLNCWTVRVFPNKNR